LSTAHSTPISNPTPSSRHPSAAGHPSPLSVRTKPPPSASSVISVPTYPRPCLAALACEANTFFCYGLRFFLLSIRLARGFFFFKPVLSTVCKGAWLFPFWASDVVPQWQQDLEFLLGSRASRFPSDLAPPVACSFFFGLRQTPTRQPLFYSLMSPFPLYFGRPQYNQADIISLFLPRGFSALVFFLEGRTLSFVQRTSPI